VGEIKSDQTADVLKKKIFESGEVVRNLEEKFRKRRDFMVRKV